MPSFVGHFLVASPHLLDPNFARAVVLLVQHNEEGALGMIVNRPVDKTVQDLWREIGGGPCQSAEPVYLGGPVPGPLMAVHRSESLAELEILPGVFFCASKPNLDALVERTGEPLKIFVGHSGWGPGQLDSELEQGAWLTTPATVELIFYDGGDLWNAVTRQIGRQMLREMLRPKEIPDDPSVN
jgi:putative transcriptional regulator